MHSAPVMDACRREHGVEAVAWDRVWARGGNARGGKVASDNRSAGGRDSARDSRVLPQPDQAVAVAPDNGSVAGAVSAAAGRGIRLLGRGPAGDAATGDGR